MPVQTKMYTPKRTGWLADLPSDIESLRVYERQHRLECYRHSKAKRKQAAGMAMWKANQAKAELERLEQRELERRGHYTPVGTNAEVRSQDVVCLTDPRAGMADAPLELLRIACEYIADSAFAEYEQFKAQHSEFYFASDERYSYQVWCSLVGDHVVPDMVITMTA